jgi:hypothetical protein
MVVPGDQYSEYRYHIPLDIAIVPFYGTGIGAKRDYILRHRSSGKIIMMDDDLAFYKRNESGEKFARLPTRSPDTLLMIEDICTALDRYPAVGLVDKFMSQTRPRVMQECVRYNQVLGFNRETLPNPWPAFKIKHDEEHNFHLQLLTKGIKTCVLTEWSKADRPNSKGGCSDWRSSEIYQETYQQLLTDWPEIVIIKNGRARYNWRKAKEVGGIK